MKRHWLVVVLLLFGLSAFAQEESTKGTYDQTAQEIEKLILKQDKVKIDDFKVLHQGDTIYLEGVSDLFGSYYYAGKIAGEYQGIKNVDNQISIRKKNVADEDIQGKLIQIIQKNERSEPFDLISVKVNHGFVTLYGNIVDTPLKEKVMKEAVWIPGVINIDDKIEFASIGLADKRLRVQIYQLIQAGFPQYFKGRHPSIIILVNYGRVTLVGYVDSNPDKQRILSAVRTMTGVLSVEDQLQTD